MGEHIQSDIADVKADLRDIRAETRGIRHDMQTNFRILFGAIITTAIGLVGVIAKGFGWL